MHVFLSFWEPLVLLDKVNFSVQSYARVIERQLKEMPLFTSAFKPQFEATYGCDCLMEWCHREQGSMA